MFEAQVQVPITSAPVAPAGGRALFYALQESETEEVQGLLLDVCVA